MGHQGVVLCMSPTISEKISEKSHLSPHYHCVILLMFRSHSGITCYPLSYYLSLHPTFVLRFLWSMTCWLHRVQPFITAPWSPPPTPKVPFGTIYYSTAENHLLYILRYLLLSHWHFPPALSHAYILSYHFISILLSCWSFLLCRERTLHSIEQLYHI